MDRKNIHIDDSRGSQITKSKTPFSKNTNSGQTNILSARDGNS